MDNCYDVSNVVVELQETEFGFFSNIIFLYPLKKAEIECIYFLNLKHYLSFLSFIFICIPTFAGWKEFSAY